MVKDKQLQDELLDGVEEADQQIIGYLNKKGGKTLTDEILIMMTKIY